MKEEDQKYLLKIRKAIEQKQGLSFKYQHPDGQVTNHNAVYPQKIYRSGKHIYFRAYCYFTHDVRTFRLDRIHSLRLTRRKTSTQLPNFLKFAALILLIFASYTIWTLSGGNPRGEWVLVTYVFDGDTIGVGRGWRYEKVRLIGVDTPETVHPQKPVEKFGPEASEFTKKRLKGRKVHLEFEPTNEYDHYGRLLAYVFLMDGTFFNAELIKQGYARVIAPTPFRYYREFKRYEYEAKRAGLGIWSNK
jgi:endonuclease YncB( thermonuclease family)